MRKILVVSLLSISGAIAYYASLPMNEISETAQVIPAGGSYGVAKSQDGSIEPQPLPDLNPLAKQAELDKVLSQIKTESLNEDVLRQELEAQEEKIQMLVERLDDNLDDLSEREAIEEQLKAVSDDYKKLTLSLAKLSLKEASNAPQE
jgi:hypothetical protein